MKNLNNFKLNDRVRITNSFGQRLRQLKGDMMWSEIAKKVGLKQKTLENVAYGTATTLARYEIEAIASAFDVTIEWLYSKDKVSSVETGDKTINKCADEMFDCIIAEIKNPGAKNKETGFYERTQAQILMARLFDMTQQKEKESGAK